MAGEPLAGTLERTRQIRLATCWPTLEPVLVTVTGLTSTGSREGFCNGASRVGCSGKGGHKARPYITNPPGNPWQVFLVAHLGRWASLKYRAERGRRFRTFAPWQGCEYPVRVGRLSGPEGIPLSLKAYSSRSHRSRTLDTRTTTELSQQGFFVLAEVIIYRCPLHHPNLLLKLIYPVLKSFVAAQYQGDSLRDGVGKVCMVKLGHWVRFFLDYFARDTHYCRERRNGLHNNRARADLRIIPQDNRAKDRGSAPQGHTVAYRWVTLAFIQ